MSVYIANNPRDKKAVGLASKGEPVASQAQRVTIPFRGPMLRMIGFTIGAGIMLTCMFPILSLFIATPPPAGPHDIQPKMQLANAIVPILHQLTGVAMVVGPLMVILAVCALVFGGMTHSVSVPTPSIAGDHALREFRRFVADGRLTEVHPEIIAGATRWATQHKFSIITGPSTDASLARHIYEMEAEDRRAALGRLIERHAAVLAKAHASGILTKADLASLDDVTREFEQLTRISVGDRQPMHIQQIMALHAAIIKMLAPQVALLDIKEVSVADKAEIRRELRAWGAWMAETEQALMNEHPTDEAIGAEVARDMVRQVRALTPTA